MRYASNLSRYNDNGKTLCRTLAFEGLRFSDEEGVFTIPIEFLMRQVDENPYDLAGVALGVLTELNNLEIAQDLEMLYYNHLTNWNRDKKNNVVFALMEMKYLPAEKLYLKAIDNEGNRNIATQFYLILRYCSINRLRGIELLVKYYCENLTSKTGFPFEGTMAQMSLFGYFKNENFVGLIEILNRTTENSNLSGALLKEMLLSFLHSDLTNLNANQKNELINRIALS